MFWQAGELTTIAAASSIEAGEFMALDFNTVKFLFWANRLGLSFGRTLTLGRQQFLCSRADLGRLAEEFCFAGATSLEDSFRRTGQEPLYAEGFLKYAGAEEMVSADYSAFEGANLVHDLNRPFPDHWHGHFDFVLDAGTLEHIFNYPAALVHCLETVRPQGHFVTITPANNFMGHGFYQFSPELFFRVFSEENGFVLKKIILHDMFKTDAVFYEVKDPAITGLRTELLCSRPMVLLVLAQRITERPLILQPPLQSDYVAVWKRAETTVPAAGAAAGVLSQLRSKLQPHWPQWLRRRKQAFVYRRIHGRPNLGNQRHFRAICREELREPRRPE